MPNMPPRSTWVWLVEAALAEDLGPGDATSQAVLPEGLEGTARIEAREELVVCGLDVAREVFARCQATWTAQEMDNETIPAGRTLATVSGSAHAILAAERTALNFLQRLSGVATLTHTYCEALRGTRARLLDTRKTTPGWRTLEKYAVQCGGGTNHRTGLFDGILIKDNHIRAVGGVADAVKRARAQASPHLRIRIEVESVEAARAALDAGADALLVDNQPPQVLQEISALASGRARVEASGGIDLSTLEAVARSGVDEISVGALTHSARAMDIALEWNDPCSS